MKKFLASTAAVAAIAGLMVIGTAKAQNAAPAANLPHKVGLIDMAHIFKNYKKFEALREDLKVEIQASEEKAKGSVAQMKALEEQMKQTTPGSPDNVKFEKQLLGLKADFDAYRASMQRDFLRKESQIYKTVYLEVEDAVGLYAKHYKYTLIMRFNREGLDVAAEPNDVLQRMNRQVIYHQESDDITMAVLDYLNDKYSRTPNGVVPRVGGGANPKAPKRN